MALNWPRSRAIVGRAGATIVMSSAARNMETTAPVRMAWTLRRERARRGSPAPILLTGVLSSADITLLLASWLPEPTPGYGMEALRIFHGWPEPPAHRRPPRQRSSVTPRQMAAIKP